MNTVSNKSPQVITSPEAMQQLMLSARSEGKKVAFVPTMGYLHQGHLSLMEQSRKDADILVLSIFVNPTQFGVGEDFESYPRDLESDLSVATGAGVDYVFAPEAADMYPKGYTTFVDVEGITDTLCGASRPGHFRGVTTVVNKLFGIVQPDVAYFGCKDFQQLAVIKRMVDDLNMSVKVVGMPIVREADGLAMSSRNVHLSSSERKQALALITSIKTAVKLVADGETDTEQVLNEVRTIIEAEPDALIDYAAIRHDRTLEPMQVVNDHSVILLAVKVGNTRLIDNHYLCKQVEL